MIKAGLRSRRTNETAPAPAPAPELHFHEHGSGSGIRSSILSYPGSGVCSFLHINIFNCLGVPQVEWKMKYI